ncbi:hypothetical protein [Streptococcus salivarius]|uniref:DUF8208 domain-containing protein n=1 Tax=Streptococcus salivarius K12 TaxID=1200793 RepID=J7TMK7_STRSL|nr:hypothetical protein [Streptococcus salivarius]EJO15324.1 hypothetical protein RSSL_00083 [Streptococcus salivarius K12]MBZ5836677.1 hypothetical protein [Streptococcus salivarius]
MGAEATIEIEQGKVWPSLSDMISQSKDWPNEVGSKGWGGDKDKELLLASFYAQWDQYLHPTTGVFIAFGFIPEMLSKGIYSFSYAIEKAYLNMFKLFGMFDYISQSDSFVGQVYKWLQIVGISLFVLVTLIRLIMAIAGAPFRYREFFNHIILVTFSVTALPVFASKFGSAIAKDTVGLAYYDITGSGQSVSLSVTPFRNNTVDLEMLYAMDFDTDKLGYNEDTHFIAGDKNWNTISDGNIWFTNFTETYGPTNKAMLQYYSGREGRVSSLPKMLGIREDGSVDWGQQVKNGVAMSNPVTALLQTSKLFFTGWKEEKDLKEDQANSPYNGFSDVMRSTLNTIRYADGKIAYARVTTSKSGYFLGFDNTAFLPTYARYKVDWIALITQQIIILLLLIGLLVTTVRVIFKTLITVIISPLVSYAAVGNSMRILEVWQEVMTGIAAIWFQLLFVKVAQWFLITYSEVKLNLGSGASAAAKKTLGGSFYDGLDPFQHAIATIAVYLGVYLAVSQGSKVLERWLGIDTNLSSGTKAGVATMAVGAMAARKMGGGARNFAVGRYNPTTGRRNQSGFNHLKNSVGSGINGLRDAGGAVGATANNIRRGALTAAGATAGTVAGTWNAMADRRAHGLKYREIVGQSVSATGRNVSRRFKETVKSGKEVVGNEFRNAGQSVKRDFSSSFGKGYTSSRDNVRDKILNSTGGAGRITPKGDTSNITPPTQSLPKKNSLDSDSRFQKFDAGEDGEL